MLKKKEKKCIQTYVNHDLCTVHSLQTVDPSLFRTKKELKVKTILEFFDYINLVLDLHSGHEGWFHSAFQTYHSKAIYRI
jgi:hypothetical protein